MGLTERRLPGARMVAIRCILGALLLVTVASGASLGASEQDCFEGRVFDCAEYARSKLPICPTPPICLLRETIEVASPDYPEIRP